VNEAQTIKGLLHSLHQVIAAGRRRAERDRLSKEARIDLIQQFGLLDDNQLEVKWKEIEYWAQLFRELFYSGEDGMRNVRIIDLVWQGVANNKVNVDRDRIDNMDYTGAHIQALEQAGITLDQYEAKWIELNDRYEKLTGTRYTL
jgi:hypothetical protein